MSFRSILVPLLLSATCLCSTVSQNCFPEGIRDPDRPVAYIQTGNGLKALRVLDGSSIWSEPTAGRPIALWGSGIVVLVGLSRQSFRFDVLARTTGELTLRSKPVSIPPGSSLGPPAMCPNYTLFSENKLTLRWQVTSHYTGGASPPRDLATGKAEANMEVILDQSNGKLLISLHEVPEKVAERVLPETASYLRNGTLSYEPWEVDDVSLSLVRKQRSCSLYLEIRVVGGQTIPREMQLSCPHDDKAPHVTADGMYIVVGEGEDAWRIYSSNDGREIGRISARSLYEPCVVENQIYYRSKDLSGVGSVIAENVKTGKVIWSVPLSENESERRPKLPQ